jgi:hypothetical protein
MAIAPILAVQYDGRVRYYRQKRGYFYFSLSVFLFAGLLMLLTPHRMDLFNGEYYWFAPLLRYSPFMMLAIAPLYGVSYFLSYFETLPDSLESRHLWRRKYVSYSEINRISPHKTWFGGITVGLRYSRVRNLPVFVDRPAAFLVDIAARAPQARMEDSPTTK